MKTTSILIICCIVFVLNGCSSIWTHKVVSGRGNAYSLNVSVVESNSNKTEIYNKYNYSISIDCNGDIFSIADQRIPTEGDLIKQSNEFTIENGYLVKSKLIVTRADEILFEGKKGGEEFVVARRYYLTYSSFKKFISYHYSLEKD